MWLDRGYKRHDSAGMAKGCLQIWKRPPTMEDFVRSSARLVSVKEQEKADYYKKCALHEMSICMMQRRQRGY